MYKVGSREVRGRGEMAGVQERCKLGGYVAKLAKREMFLGVSRKICRNCALMQDERQITCSLSHVLISTLTYPQAQWRGAEVAVKVMATRDQVGFDASVSEAVTGRMLAHPFVVNSYVVAVMSGEEVMAAIPASRGSSEGGSQADVDSNKYGQGSSGSRGLTMRTSAAEEIERLLGMLGSESVIGSAGDHGSGPEVVDDLGTGGGPFIGYLSHQSAPSLQPQQHRRSPPSASSSAAAGASVAADTADDDAAAVNTAAVGTAVGTVAVAGTSADPSAGTVTATGASADGALRPRRRSLFSGPQNAQFHGVAGQTFGQVARTLALGPGQHVTAIVVSDECRPQNFGHRDKEARAMALVHKQHDAAIVVTVGGGALSPAPANTHSDGVL